MTGKYPVSQEGKEEMAERRMLSRKVTETDAFYSMGSGPASLYLHLSLNADDDGFLDNVKSIMTMCGAKPNDLSALIKNGYILQVSEHVYVIRHWKVNNWIQSDRYHPTMHDEEKAMLCCVNNVWTYREGQVWQSPYPVDTEEREDKKSKEEVKHKYGVYKHVMLTDKEYEELVDQFPFNFQSKINNLDEYLENNPKKHYANHLLTIRKWARRDGQQKKRESWTEIADQLSDEMDL